MFIRYFFLFLHMEYAGIILQGKTWCTLYIKVKLWAKLQWNTVIIYRWQLSCFWISFRSAVELVC